MKTFTSLLIGLLLVCTIAVQAQTTINSNIVTNTTWTAANSPYIISANITVSANVTLNIESGVEVKFDAGRYIVVRGTMNATNTVFTGNNGITKGFWDGIYVSHSSYEDGSVSLTGCTIEHATQINTRKGTLTLDGCTLNNFSGSGVVIEALGILDIANTTISNTDYPIRFTGAGAFNPGENLTFTDNTNNFAHINFSTLNTQLHLKKLNIPYYTNNTLTVSNTGELLINPGVQLYFHHNGEIRIDGKFKALGTESEKIIFNRHSTANYYQGIVFRANSIDADCVMQHCEINNNANSNYGNTALSIQSASPAIENCNFNNNSYNVSITGDSKPVFVNCNFGASVRTDAEANNITMDLNAQPVFTNCNIAFNETELRAVSIIASTVTVNNTLKKISFNGVENITYCMYDLTTIAETGSLVIEPGVVIKSRNSNTNLVAVGTLTGIGTAGEPIILTALSDDNFGNPADTQNNGTTNPSYSSWGRISLNSTAESKLENWKIHYSGTSSSYWAVYVTKNNIVNNCEIRYSSNGIRFTENAVVTNNDFINITNYPVSYIVSNGTPDLQGNTISNVGFSGIHIDAFANDSPTLKKIPFAGNSNPPFIINNSLQIAVGNTVTIVPGIIIKNIYYGGLDVRGTLKATGTPSERIVFTSIHDDSKGGDTNNNGTATIPNNYDWNGIVFNNTTSIENSLKFCDVTYGGSNTTTVTFYNSFAELDNITIKFSGNNGLGVFETSNPKVSNTLFSNIAQAPVYMDLFSGPEFLSGNQMSNIGIHALKLRGGTVDGTIPARNFAGINNIAYLAEETYNSYTELTIPAGIVFKGRSRWNIRGKLNILGTTEAPVVFTSNNDDAYGNPADTEGNGNTTPTNRGGYFVFYDSSDDTSVIDNTIFRYSYTNPVALTNASPTIQNSKFQNVIYSAILVQGTSQPKINNNTFDNVLFPFETSLATFPGQTTGNVLTGTTARAIRVNNETLNLDATISKRDFGGITNIPYVFQYYTVGTGAKLTINPGVILKFMRYGYINVQNGLLAIGGAEKENQIIFTADSDDFYGGDTYNDGMSQTSKSWWDGIRFYNESNDADCILKHAIIKHASNSYSATSNSHRGAITVDNASPTIQNVRFISNTSAIVSFNVSQPIISNCDFTDCGSFAVNNRTPINVISAENSWWDNVTGPTHASNPGGTGAPITDGVLFSPILSELGIPENGDVSLNGTINPFDASLILQHAVSAITLNTKQQTVADVSGNGAITSYDASMILQYNVGLISVFMKDPNNVLKMQKVASAQDNANIELSEIQFDTGGYIKIPVYLTTKNGVKSMDMKYSFDNSHLSFIGINSEEVPNGITAVHHANDKDLFVSMASAYDLTLDKTPLYLIFEVKNSTALSSELTLNRALANETSLNTEGISIIIPGKTPTGIQSVKNDGKIHTWKADQTLFIKMDLADAEKELTLTVTDISGKTVALRTMDNVNAGVQTVEIPVTSSGIHIVRLIGKNINAAKKVVL